MQDSNGGCPCHSAGLEEQQKEPTGHPTCAHVGTLNLCVVGASCSQNLGVPALLGMIHVGHSICITFRSKSAS